MVFRLDSLVLRFQIPYKILVLLKHICHGLVHTVQHGLGQLRAGRHTALQPLHFGGLRLDRTLRLVLSPLVGLLLAAWFCRLLLDDR
jgi:hypothetical protein